MPSKFPAVPSVAFSHLGPVPVKLEDPPESPNEEETAIGFFQLAERSIYIKPEMPEARTWHTYWHEVCHLVLSDAGLSNTMLEPTTEEAVCDALGTYLAAAVRAGFITVNPQEGE